MIKRRGRIAAALAFLGLLLVVLFAFLKWDELAKRFYLHRLRTDPEYLTEFLERPESSIKREVLGEFIESPQGKETLVGLFCNEIISRKDKILCIGGAPASRSKDLTRLLIGLNRSYFWFAARRLSNPGGDAGWGFAPEPEVHYAALREYLPVLFGESVVWPGRPDLRLTFMSWNQFQAIVREEKKSYLSLYPLRGVPSDSTQPGDDPICVVAPRGKEYVAFVVASLTQENSRYHAVRLLGELGREAKIAVPELKRLVASTQDSRIVEAATDALSKIQRHESPSR